ncbi:MAG: AIR carboxylase family protein [Chloroflexota bacterium]
MPLVIILMGSKADETHCLKIAEAAKSYGLDVVMRVGSAHKTPAHVMDVLRCYENDPVPKVYITVAGRSNALSGFVDGLVTSPVLACPPPSESYGGADIYSSLRMPSGVAPGVVLDPGNAALLAAKIFAVNDPRVRAKIQEAQKKLVDKILADDKSVLK